MGCCIWYKDTNLKANHNVEHVVNVALIVVVYGTKILIWKQITTVNVDECYPFSCCIWYKDTNLKANHNCVCCEHGQGWVVVYGTKILIWKQITTTIGKHISCFCCCIWYKDTNLKAKWQSYNEKKAMVGWLSPLVFIGGWD